MENKKLIDNAIRFIQKNPKNNLSLQSIADNAGFSLTYFDAIFKSHTGYTPVEYSRIYKLTRSALELRRSDKTILDIALDFGYSSPESFTRAFKSFYSLTPSEYREKYSAVTENWHDRSAKIAISHFRNCFPELKRSDIDLALDFCFTHNQLKFAEDIVGMTVADCEILTLGNPNALEHFIYVSDYNSAEPAVMLICEKEKDALEYLKLLTKLKNPVFSVRKDVNTEWETFDAEVAKLSLTCRQGYDMIYPLNNVNIPNYEGLEVRLLTAKDMPYIKAFKQNGGCAECHVRAIQIHFDGKGNTGMMPIGVFEKEDLVGLAMPTLDEIRELRKYDIGAIFFNNSPKQENALELLWKFTIEYCINNNATVGNGNACEDDSPLGVDICERMGLIKVAKNCLYSK